MKKKAKPRSSRIYAEVQLTGIRHSNTLHRLATIERLLQEYSRIEWASYDPRGRSRQASPGKSPTETSSSQDEDEFD